MRIYILTCEDPLFSDRIFKHLFKTLPNQIVGVGFAAGLVTFDRVVVTLLVYGPINFLKFGFEVFRTTLFGSGKVEKVCAENGISVDKPKTIKSQEFLENLKRLEPDLIVSINCNEIIGKTIREIPKYGVINLHNGDLPRYRGLMPIFHAIRLREKSIGVSVQEIDSGKLDSGPILGQEKMDLLEKEDLLSAWSRATEVGSNLLLKVIRNLQNNECLPQKNDEKLATYYTLPSFREIYQYWKIIK